jgi:hypothetical protein
MENWELKFHHFTVFLAAIFKLLCNFAILLRKGKKIHKSLYVSTSKYFKVWSLPASYVACGGCLFVVRYADVGNGAGCE